jgi:hypothetical protein
VDAYVDEVMDNTFGMQLAEVLNYSVYGILRNNFTVHIYLVTPFPAPKDGVKYTYWFRSPFPRAVLIWQR